MLATFRNHAKGWIAWVFVILVTVPFAFWGIGQYRSLITTNYVAKVNGHKIMPAAFQRAYNAAFRRQQSKLGNNWDPSTAEQKALKDQVLEQLISETILQQQASADRLVANEAEVQAQIRQYPAFQANGKFNFTQYQQVLAENGMTTSGFESQVRTDVALGQLQNGIGASVFVMPKQLSSLMQLFEQKRDVAWFSLPVARFKPSSPPSDSQIESYYRAHSNKYYTPTALTVAYVRLDQKMLEDRVSVTDADAKAYYETHQSKYGIPAARKAGEILIKPKGSSPSDLVQAQLRAETLYAELKTAKDPQQEFARMAGHYSDDPISRRNGGSIGWIGRGQMPKPFDQALFGLGKVGDVANPVHLKDGWAVIQLLGARGGSVKPFAQIKAQVTRDAAAAKATELFYKLGDQLANLAYEHSGSLDAVAKALNLKIFTLHGVTRKAGPGIASHEAFRKAAFSDEVLKDHQNSNPIKLGPDDAVVLRVTSEDPGHPKALKEVRDEVVASLDHEQAVSGAKAAAVRAEQDLRRGKPIKLVALSFGEAAQGPRAISRDASPLPAEVTSAVFSRPPRADGRAAIGSVAMQNGDQVVYALLGIVPGNVAKAKALDRLAYARQLEQLSANAAVADYVAWLRSHASVKIEKGNIP